MVTTANHRTRLLFLWQSDQPNGNDFNRFHTLTNGTVAARRDDGRGWRPSSVAHRCRLVRRRARMANWCRIRNGRARSVGAAKLQPDWEREISPHLHSAQVGRFAFARCRFLTSDGQKECINDMNRRPAVCVVELRKRDSQSKARAFAGWHQTRETVCSITGRGYLVIGYRPLTEIAQMSGQPSANTYPQRAPHVR